MMLWNYRQTDFSVPLASGSRQLEASIMATMFSRNKGPKGQASARTTAFL